MSLNRRGRLQFKLYRRSREQVLCLWIGSNVYYVRLVPGEPCLQLYFKHFLQFFLRNFKFSYFRQFLSYSINWNCDILPVSDFMLFLNVQFIYFLKNCNLIFILRRKFRLNLVKKSKIKKLKEKVRN